MLVFVNQLFLGSCSDMLHLNFTILLRNDPNEAGCQVAHINRRDRKLKGQGPKTGSGSINQPISGLILFY